MDSPDSILDDLFHGCTLAAFVEQAVTEGGWPDGEATRSRAYDAYERALAERTESRESVARGSGPSSSSDNNPTPS